MQLSAVILAGGASKRMGRDKAWVEYAGKPLLELALEKVRELGVREIFISGRPGEDYSVFQCPVLIDLEPGFGPVGGIERALHHATSPLVLVLAVDLPQMTAAFLQKLWGHCDGWSGAVPRLNGELEPLAAIYPKRCHTFAFLNLAHARYAARDFAKACLQERAVRALRVSAADAGCFANCNTRADMERLDRK